MKRTLPIFLLLCISAPFWLNYSVFYFSRIAIKAEVMEMIVSGIEGSDLVVLTFSRADAERVLQWEDDHEFRYEGQFYDLVAVEERTDSVQYTCYWDQEETFISEYFEEILFGELAQEFGDNEASNHLINLIKTPYKITTFTWETFQSPPGDAKTGAVASLYQSEFPGTASPPPKSV